MVKHVVIFKFEGSDSERRKLAAEFKAVLDTLPSKIEVLQDIEVCLNENPAESCDVVLTAVVPALADVEIYSKHPAHQAAVALIKGHVALRACVDYEI